MRVHALQERVVLCLEQREKKEVDSSIFFLGHPQLSDRSLYTGLMQTTEFLEGKQVGGRRKEKGNRKQERKRKGGGVVACLYKS
jgi:hypothetical protein